MNFYSPCPIIPKIGMDYTDYIPNENSNDGPPIQKRSRFNSEPSSEKKMEVDDLKPNHYKSGVRPNVSVDAVPEVNFIFNSNIDLTVIDAIFISNWESLKGLPFLTENKELSCPIYATEPVISLGSLIIEDLLHFFERTDKNIDDKEWVESEAWDAYVGEDPRKSVPSQWRRFYTEESLRKAISKMTRISPNQPVPVGNGIQVRLYQSGFEIGSCNWLIEVEEKKIGVWTATSKQQGYVHEPVFKHFAKLDSLILTNLREIDADPNLMIADMCATAVDTLCAGGNILFPMQPIGSIYDIIESLIGRMDQVAPNKNFPVYVFSPVSKKGLAFTNISGEWFCEEKREKLFTPKPPFKIHEFIERKRVFMYESIHSSFSTEYKVPCVAFVGHPSLRIGDAVYFMELWGNNPKNAVILSDPDFNFDFTWSPFLSSRIRAFWFPVDMRLSPSEVNNILITEVDTKKLIVPEDYVNSNSGVLKHENIVTFESSLPLKIMEVDDRINVNCFSNEIAGVVKKGEGTVIQGFMNYVGKEIQILTQKVDT